MNAWGAAILFRVTTPPRYGRLVGMGSLEPRTTFTEADLQNGHLRYVNKGDQSFRDEFRFQARIGDTTTEGIFEVKVYPESYWEPLVVLKNITAKVEEGARVTIDQAVLNIMHPNIAPSDITFVIVQRPQNGYLYIDQGPASSDSSSSSTATNHEYDDEANLLKPEVIVMCIL